MSTFSSVSDVLDRLSPDLPAEPAWGDVLGRAASLGASAPAARRRGLVVGVAFVALVATVVAAAYALGHPIVRFADAPRAQSKTVVDFFGRMTIGVPHGIAVMPHEARRITTVGGHTLLVAPMKGGGFCVDWTGEDASCQLSDSPRELTWTGALKGETLYALDGFFPQQRADRVVLRYADGGTSDIPFVWVTKPIESGFFLFEIPQAHRSRGHQPVRITLLDASGRPIVSQLVEGFVPPHPILSYKLVRHRIAGYPPLSVPAPADWAKRRQLFAWTTETGTRVGFWIAPAHGGGTCYWTNVHTGCSGAQPYWPKLRKGKGYVVLCCTIDPQATRVEAVFQDGDRVTLTPKDGYLMWPIPRRHYAPGHRLDRLVAYHAGDKRFLTLDIPPGVRALYPCVKPKDYGYGLVMCP